MIKFEVRSEPSNQYDGNHYYIRGGYYKTVAEAEKAKERLEAIQETVERWEGDAKYASVSWNMGTDKS